MRRTWIRLSPVLLLLATAAPLAAAEAGTAAAGPAPAATCATVPAAPAVSGGETALFGTAPTGELFARFTSQKPLPELQAAAGRLPSLGCFCTSTCRPLYICTCKGTAACCGSCCQFAC